MSIPKPSMRPFFIIFSGQAISMLGTQAVQFGLIWWLTVRTESPSVVAAATLLALLPRALFGPVAGALIDRWDRRKIMLTADSAALKGVQDKLRQAGRQLEKLGVEHEAALNVLQSEIALEREKGRLAEGKLLQFSVYTLTDGKYDTCYGSFCFCKV